MNGSTLTNVTEATSRETVDAKIISGFVMLITTFLMTFIPAILLRKAARVRVHSTASSSDPSLQPTWRHHLMSAFNCFAAGVFISAGMLHIFKDADEEIVRGLTTRGYETEFPVTIFIALCGTFLLLAIEQFVEFLAETGKRRAPEPTLPTADPRLTQSDNFVSGSKMEFQDLSHQDGDRSPIAEEGDGHTHNDVINPHSPIQSIILVIALSVHSVLEGLALGLQHSPRGAYKLLLMLSLHKLAIALSMGINLAQVRARIWFSVVIAFIFAVASPLGAFIGIGVMEVYDPTQGLVIGVLQALACGTFIYVTFFEILPHEFGRKNCLRSVCFFSLLLGFAAVSLYTFFGGHEHGHEHGHDHEHHHH